MSNAMIRRATWKPEPFGLLEYFDEDIEYPEEIAEKGVPNNTIYTYVSTSFLNGYINYVEPMFAIMIERYVDLDTPKVRGFLELQKWAPHTTYDSSPDDVWVIAETENCWWLFWSDRDVSDCCIGRLDKSKLPKEELRQSVMSWLSKLGTSKTSDITGRYIELAPFVGWVKL